MKLFDFLAEALPLSVAKTYRKEWDPFKYESLFRRFTDDPKAYRIYIPLEAEKTEKEVVVPPSISKALFDAGFTIEDYIEGFAKKGNQRIKIGKILQRIDPSLKSAFDSDAQRQGKNTSGLEVVISRHPYDVAGMSTDRGWSSCMALATKDNPSGGVNKRYVLSDVKQGTIIAYLINKNDRNIKKPVARMLIKPFIEKKTKEVILVAEGQVYGTSSRKFKSTVNKWLGEVNKDKITGLYAVAPKLYSDDLKPSVYHVGDTSNLTKDQIIKILDKGSADTLERISPYLNTPEMWKLAMETSLKNLKYCSGEGFKDFIIKSALKEPTWRAARYFNHANLTLSDAEWINLIKKKPKMFSEHSWETPLPEPVQEWLLKKEPKILQYLPGISKHIMLKLFVQHPKYVNWDEIDTKFLMKHGVEILEANPDSDMAISMLNMFDGEMQKIPERLVCTIIHVNPKKAILELARDYSDGGVPDVVYRFAIAYHFNIIKSNLMDSEFNDMPAKYLLIMANKDRTVREYILDNINEFDKIDDTNIVDFIMLDPRKAENVIDEYTSRRIWSLAKQQQKKIDILLKYPELQVHITDQTLLKKLKKKAPKPA